MTMAQLLAHGASNVLKRLMASKRHLLALRIATALDLNPEQVRLEGIHSRNQSSNDPISTALWLSTPLLLSLRCWCTGRVQKSQQQDLPQTPN